MNENIRNRILYTFLLFRQYYKAVIVKLNKKYEKTMLNS